MDSSDPSSFIVTLPSNASMDLNPDNTQSHFAVQLPHPIELDGSWEVGLAEVQLPNVWYNITEKTSNFSIYQNNASIDAVVLDIMVTPKPGEDLIAAMLQSLPDKSLPVYEIQCTKRELEPEVDDYKHFKDPCMIDLWVKKGYRMQLPPDIMTVLRVINNDGNYIKTYASSYQPVEKELLVSYAQGITSFPIRVVSDFQNDPDPELFVELEAGHYPTPHILLEAIEDEIGKEIQYDRHRKAANRVFRPEIHTSYQFRLLKSYKVELVLGEHSYIKFPPHLPGLGEMLGFGKDQIGKRLFSGDVSQYPIDIKGGCYNFLIYSPLIQHQIVGDTMAELLRIIPIGNENPSRQTYVKIYDNPDYFPLSTNRFGNIEIFVYTDAGDLAKFIAGKTVVKLRFRKQTFITNA